MIPSQGTKIPQAMQRSQKKKKRERERKKERKKLHHPILLKTLQWLPAAFKIKSPFLMECNGHDTLWYPEVDLAENHSLEKSSGSGSTTKQPLVGAAGGKKASLFLWGCETLGWEKASGSTYFHRKVSMVIVIEWLS